MSRTRALRPSCLALLTPRRTAARMPAMCWRMVLARVTKGFRPLREALEPNRSSSRATSSWPRSPAKTSRRASLRVYARHQVLEVFGELGAHPGKGDALDSHPVGGTGKAPQVGPELQAPATQIQMAPAGGHGPGVVAVASGVVALGAHQPPPSQDDGDGHRLGVEGHVDDVDAGQGQKALKCSGDAHGQAPFGFAVLTATNLPGLRARQLPIAGVPGVPAP